MKLEQLSIRYGKQEIIAPFNLEINSGEIFVLMGPSGSGKTTLLRGIAGLTPLSAGNIKFDNAQGSIGLAFQEPRLFPHMNVMDNLAFGLRAKGYSKSERYSMVEKYLSVLQLEGLETRFPHELSGGQKQRVSLGRVIILKPKILLLDEPFSSLDTPLRYELTEWLYQLQKEQGFSVFWVTHYLDEAFSVADRIGVIINGQIKQVGPPVEVYQKPCSEEVASFFSLPNRFSKELWESLFQNQPTREGCEMGWISADALTLKNNENNSNRDDKLTAEVEGIVQRIKPEKNGHTIIVESGRDSWTVFVAASVAVPAINSSVEVMIPYDKIMWYSK